MPLFLFGSLSNLSNTFSRRSAGIPAPLSPTQHSTAADAASAPALPTTTSPFGV